MAKEATKVTPEDTLDDLLGVVETIDQETVETQTQTFPIIQWVNGKSALKRSGGVPYTGGWFISQQSTGDMQELPGWEKDVLATQSGEEVPGFYKRDIRIAYLYRRLRWRVTGADNNQLSFPWNEYDAALTAGRGKKPSGNIQILCWVEGLDLINPVVITAKGYVCKELLGNRQTEGVIDSFVNRVVGTINTALHKQGTSKNMPWRAFWMSIGPQREADGTPRYVQVGSGTAVSLITLPALIGVPPRPSVGQAKELFVGQPLLATLNTLYSEPRCTEWAAAWDIRQGETAPVEPATDNRPQISSQAVDGDGVADIGDEEIPF